MKDNLIREKSFEFAVKILTAIQKTTKENN
jgi:hypothetical protein